MVKEDKSLTRLRQIRDELNRMEALVAERDKLIRRCSRKHTQSHLAIASGLSRQRVAQIVNGY